jgi:hypothetical protein
MSIKISLSREDVMAATVLKPGWYLCTVKDVWQEAAKTDGSTNTWVKFVVKEGEFKDTPLRKNFSEKWMNPIVGYIECFIGTGKYVPDTEVDIEGSKGKDIRVQIQNKLYNGVTQNEVIGFKAA